MPSDPSFPDVAGHEASRAFLGRLVEEGRLPHAILLAGPDGIGKTLLARGLARGKLCGTGPSQGCGTCASCRVFESGAHADFLLVDPPGSTIPIAAIRGAEGEPEGSAGASAPGLVDWIGRKAMGPQGKCALVRDAGRMNVFAQNALLKTLEEPPAGSLLLLTAASVDSLLGTVASRCLCLRLRPLPIEEVERHLREKGEGGASSRGEAAALSGGSIGGALEILGESPGSVREQAERLLAGEGFDPSLRDVLFSSLGAKSTAADRRALARLFLTRAGILLRERWRDAVARGGGASYVPSPDPSRALEDLLATAGRALRDLEANVEPGLLLDLLEADVTRACRLTPPSGTG